MFKHIIRRYLPIALVLSLVLFASFGSSGQAAAAGETDLGRAIAAQEAHTDALMSIDGVIGTAVGRGSGGHVVLALTTSAGVSGIPNSVDGVTVRPYITGEILAQPKPGSGGVDRTSRFTRPVPIGVSTGHPDITAGTIGARVVDDQGTSDTSDDVYYALSNNHVYANQNDANIGDVVIQPGAFDGGTLADPIGNLSDFETIVFSTSASNVIDAAIAVTTTSLLGNSTPDGEGYGTPSSTPWDATIGMNVMKYGRTTGDTSGKVDAINATVNVGYDTGTARFVGQVIIKGRKGSFSAGGDSGSLIVSKDGNHPVALLFAGSSSTTIGNPIGPVLSAFGVSIDGVGVAPPSNDAPNVTITAPDDGSSFNLNDSITFTGTAADTEDTGLSAEGLTWSSSIAGTIGSGASFSTTLNAGTHTITASVTDTGGATGSDSITVVVIDPNAPLMTVGSISFVELHRGPHTDLVFTIVVNNVDANGNLGAPVAGANITGLLFRVGNDWLIGGTTDASGSYSGKLRSARVGIEYTVRVDDVSHNNLNYAPGLTQNSCTVGTDCDTGP